MNADFNDFDFNFVLLLLDGSHYSGAIDVKMDGSVLEEKSFGALTLSLLLKLPTRKMEP